VAEKPEAPAAADQVDLKDPTLAALLAWLVPGAGHFYQGRHAKGAIFLVCILATFSYGMVLGRGRCVYFQWDPANMRRWSYLCQVGVGLPALPALVGAFRANREQTTLPYVPGEYYMPPRPVEYGRVQPYSDWDRAARGEISVTRSEYDDWSSDGNREFELGTVFTMIAGLLNLLVIYDAWQGPAFGALSLGKSRRDEKEPATAS
jgi:hypothetical protein